jgi:hypothetical protein
VTSTDDAQTEESQTDAESADEEQVERIDLTLDVMLGEPGGSTFNTIVLGGTDIIVPLERDLDGDPYQDDEIWLESLDGSFRERRYSSDPDVVPDEDKNVLLYHFRHVPYGVFNIVAVVAGRPLVVYSGLIVRKEGAFMGQDKLGQDYDACSASEADDEAAEDGQPAEEGGDEEDFVDAYGENPEEDDFDEEDAEPEDDGSDSDDDDSEPEEDDEDAPSDPEA